MPHSFTKSSYIHSALQDNGMNDESDEESVNGVNEKGLWVDKYSPKAYVELLSDDVSIFVQYYCVKQGLSNLFKWRAK